LRLTFRKNLAAAVADAVVVAEIIHSQYPKLIQVRPDILLAAISIFIFLDIAAQLHGAE
jgi:hypothetical protein